jgi:hypothetical protein
MRDRLSLPRFLPWCIATVTALGTAGALAAQTSATSSPGTGVVRGTVTTTSGGPIGGAYLRLSLPNRGSTTSVESDEDGKFNAVGVPAGPAWLVARRIGYRPDSVQVTVNAGETVESTVHLERIAVELDRVQVIGRRDVTGPMAGFYKRMGQGAGRFFTASDIDRRNASRMSDMFRMIPGMRIESRGFQSAIRMRGSRCAPLVWLDAQPLFAGEVDLDAFDPRTF